MGLGFMVYGKPHKVGNRIKAKWCWDSLYITLKDGGYWFSNFWASTVGFKVWASGSLNPKP